MVSKPVYLGGLGFGMKWDMGWMHDTLRYFQNDPIHRKYHHNDLTFRMLYSFQENFVLPLSHDEVVHGKGSLIGKMPGDEWQKFANLRLLFGYMYAQAGKKLLFMGGEFGQVREWAHDTSLEWHVLQYQVHRGVQAWVEQLNRLYRVGAPHGGYWREMLNSDAREYAGSGIGNFGGVQAEEMPMHGRPFSLKLTLPPLGALFLKAT
jgi:1,4-alpha-glucan branching enzyme